MNNSLHLEVQGRGQTLVLVHGWGFHGGVWDSLAEHLADDFQVIRPDLPGHGRSAMIDADYRLHKVVDATVEAVSRVATGPAVWVGWSLGSMIAFSAAIRHPDQVSGLVSMAGTPCFTARQGWKHGVMRELLDRFGDELTGDWKTALRRFLALQGQGCDSRLLRQVRSVVMQRMPRLEGLRGALRLLRDEDLRHQMEDIECPVLAIAGARDNLVPIRGTQAWLPQMRDGRLLAFKDSGHIPFLTNPTEVENAIRGFASYAPVRQGPVPVVVEPALTTVQRVG